MPFGLCWQGKKANPESRSLRASKKRERAEGGGVVVWLMLARQKGKSGVPFIASEQDSGFMQSKLENLMVQLL